MSELDTVMSQRSDFELFEILNYKKDSYKTEALDAARKEFDTRAISTRKLDKFEEQIQKKIDLKTENKKQKNKLKKKIVYISTFLIPTEKNTLSKTIVSLCVFLMITYAYYLFNNIRMIIASFEDIANWDLSYVEYLLPYILFPIGIYGLWKGKKHGWYLITGLLTYYAFSTIYSAISTYKYYTGNNEGLFSVLDSLIPKPSILSIVFRFAILFGIISFLNQSKVLEIFTIKRTNALSFALVIFIITSILWWSLM